MSITDELRKWGDSRTMESTQNTIRDFADSIEEAVSSEYVRLPVDANGEAWHIGDVVEDGTTVKAMRLDSHGWVFLGQKNIDPSIHHHQHELTIEGVLFEFANEVQTCWDTVDTISEYAEKLREVMEYEHA